MGYVPKKLTKNERLIAIFDDYIEDGLIPKLSEDEYKKQLKYFKRIKSKKLPYIYDIDHFCKLTNSSSNQVRFFLSNKEKAYTTFKVPKKCGDFREINAPSKKMKSIQRWILDEILYKLNPGDYAHGFIPGKTIYTNAKAHTNKDLVLGIDIKDFFPSIKFGAIYNVFKNAGYNLKVAWQLADLCTYHWKLPQGAPTSPMLANLVALNLDNQISQYCITRNFEYSRYADDITISGSYELPIHKERIIKIIKGSGFEINSKKVRMLSKGSRQKVTGLVVNDKVSIGRTKKKTLRALVHNILINGPVIENKSNDPYFRERIFGHLGCANSIDPEFASPLIDSLKKIDWTNYDEELTDLRESELIIRSLEKQNYYYPVDANQTIESESDFLEAIFSTIIELKHYIEDRRWTDPFWDDARVVEIDGTKHKIPAIPKKETKIQPTLHIFFSRNLLRSGIQVLRETDEGIGKLDFKFLITIKGNIPLNVCAEFKLAHNEELEHGLTKQLPLYLNASPSKSGIFLVMWFKDEKGEYFSKPINQSKSQMLKFIEEAVIGINEKEEFKIKSILIDASKKPPASQT